MLLKKWNNLGGLKLDANGGAGGGTASLLTPNPSGGAGDPAAGNADPNAGTNQPPPAAAANAGGATAGSAPTDWRSQLPPELQEDASIKKFTDLPSLARSYVAAQKLVGADKIAIPGKHATEDDWRQVYTKLGLPETVDKYEVKFKEGTTIDEDFAKSFKESAFKAGVPPKQAQALVDWFSEENLRSEEKFLASHKTKQEAGIAGLKSEWGTAFDLQVARAQKVFTTHADAATQKYMADTGLINDPQVVKMLAKIGSEMYKEDKEVRGAGAPGSMTPADALKEIAKIQGQQDHPYYNRSHPNHKAAVAEMQSLYQMAHTS